MTLASEFLAPGFYLSALAVTLASGYLIYRQTLVAYQVMRSFLLVVYALVTILILLEFWRIVYGTPTFMAVYAPLSVALGLIQAIALAGAAVGMYIRPIGSNYRVFLRDLRANATHGVLLALFTLLSISTIVYVVVFRPYTIGFVASVSGGQVLAMRLPAEYIVLYVVVLFFFLGYPTALLFRAARRMPDTTLGGSLVSLPIGLAGVTIMYIVFESFIWVDGIDATGIMYLMDAGLFFFVTRNFRNAAVGAGLVLPSVKRIGIEPQGLTTTVGRRAAEFSGKPLLLVAEASIGFESAAKALVTDFLSLGRTVFVFTSRGSPVNRALSSRDDVRLYELTTSVSYYQAGERPNEVLLSANNTSIMLDALSKTFGAIADQGNAVIFDSLSDLIVSLGFEESYRFLKAAIEMGSDKRLILVFLMLSGVHESSVENIIRSLFSIELVQDASGLRVVKDPGSEGR